MLTLFKRAVAIAAGTIAIGALGVPAAQVAVADQVYPYSTSPYFGGVVNVSTGPGSITIRAVQTTVGAFPYGCWANARNMEANWTSGTRPFVQLFPRIWQVDFGSLPNGRYEVMQRCADGTSLLRERAVIVELGGGQAVTPQETPPFDPGGKKDSGTCSERIQRIFGDAGVTAELTEIVVERLGGPRHLESGFQILCGAIDSDPAAFCRAAQAYFPVDLGMDIMNRIYGEVDRLLGQDNSQGREAVIQWWQGACSPLSRR
ncbi:hypothetical protein [Nocardia suismassiliense]|uniref:hypothetical protein n=1 Tax=Nocardia suismassiliense TaxID=2077092 RepID=UPI001F42B696|nr:hypothetical protein [Nocardia suismassiliense]